jgi:hypothetical protein
MLITYQINTGYNDFLVLKRGIHIVNKIYLEKLLYFI